MGVSHGMSDALDGASSLEGRSFGHLAACSPSHAAHH